MVRSLKVLFIVFLGAASLSCTRSKSTSSKVILDTSAVHHVGAQSTFPADRKVCYGVNVKGPGLEPFQPPQNACHPHRQIFMGFIESGHELHIEVPNGPERKVELYAYLLESGVNGPCPPWSETMDYSKVYRVGETAHPLELSGGDVSLEMTATYPGEGSDLKSQLGLATDCSSAGPGTPPIAGTVSVDPVYPVNGMNWADWVINDGSNPHNAADNPCTAGTSGHYGCLHGGELRKVNVPEVASCSGATAWDSLSAFKWDCYDSVGHAVFYSKMNGDKTLKDLVSEAGWIPNQVTVDVGGVQYQSPMGAWWGNPVMALPDNSAGITTTLPTAGTVYVADGARSTKGYIIGSSNISVVAKAGMVLVHETNCDTSTVAVGAGAHSCLLQADSKDFLWIEGYFGDPAPIANTAGLLFLNTNHSVITNSAFDRFYVGAYLYNSKHNKVKWVGTSNSGFMGLKLSNSANENHVQYFRSANEAQGGVQLVTSSKNVLQHLSLHNEGTNGLSLNSAGENYISGVVISNTGGKGISLSTSHQNTFSQITIANTANQGIYMGGNNNTFHNIAIGNMPGQGLAINNSSTNYFTNLIATHTSGAAYAIQGAGSTDNRFMGFLGTGFNGQKCQLASGAVVAGGLIDINCSDAGSDGSNTYSGNNSTATLRTSYDMSASFVGPIIVDDSQNGSDTSGSAAFDVSLDWNIFDNIFRGWGKDVAAFSAGAQDKCSAGTCRIWDWQLLSGDSTLLNRGGALDVPNGAFVQASTCPAEIDGNVVTTDQKPAPNTYLTNAIEVVGDYVGDEDGLCESNENCVYTPNVGAYQGHGDIGNLDYCDFQNGTLSNIFMLAHPLNGQ